MNKLTKAQGIALKNLSEVEVALILNDWSAVRDAAIRLAAVAADRPAEGRLGAHFLFACRNCPAFHFHLRV
jgi:hypothetical protein